MTQQPTFANRGTWVNTKDQTGKPSPINSPEALRGLLRHWKNQSGYAHLTAKPENQQLRLTVSAGPARTNVVEVSSDLKSWAPVTTNLPNATGIFNREESLPGAAPERFYRVRVE